MTPGIGLVMAMGTDVETDTGDEDPQWIERPQMEIDTLADSVSAVAGALEMLVVAVAIVGVVGGVVIMAHSNTDADGITTHPNVTAGATLIVAAIIGGAIYWLLFKAVRLFSKFVKFRVESEAVRHRTEYNGSSGRTKECPDCLEDAWGYARVCPHCRYRFAPAASEPNPVGSGS
jgi:hypothetical protein